jgi:NAD(P)-dependent dehydrogenase (short-subunit alcohol dehydrogenase family)
MTPKPTLNRNTRPGALVEIEVDNVGGSAGADPLRKKIGVNLN